MAEAPWLTIVGVGENGPDGLCSASLQAVRDADVVTGPPRHLALLGVDGVPWPVPFADGVAQVLSHRGRRVVVLASGDPFWFGAGAVLTRHLDPGEWRAFPGVSTFALACARMGWAVQDTLCLGLHAKPIQRLRPVLADGLRAVLLVRDGEAVADLARYLGGEGVAASMTVMEALGGPRERVRPWPCEDIAHPVCVALAVETCAALPLASGRPDDWFASDGQITKRPIRALTLSALAPRPGEHLWDIGGGSGSVGIEWMLAHPSLRCTTVEPRADRAARIGENAARFGLDLSVVQGTAPAALAGLDRPDVVFVGGGLGPDLLDALVPLAGTRLVANAVTLETEALLLDAQARLGGDLLRIELSAAAPLGPRRGWQASRPIVQWSVTL